MPRLQIDRKLLRAPQSALNGNPPLGKKKEVKESSKPKPLDAYKEHKTYMEKSQKSYRLHLKNKH